MGFPAESPAFPMRKRGTRGKLLELPGNTVTGAQENIGRTYDVAPGLMTWDEKIWETIFEQRK